MSKKRLVKSVELHESEYWHFRKLALFPLFGVFVFGFLFWLNLSFLDWSWFYGLGDFDFFSLSRFYPFFMSYFFVSGFVVSLIGFFKGGYSKLKSFNESGLVWCLVWCLVWGLGSGLIAGLGSGLIAGLNEEFKKVV